VFRVGPWLEALERLAGGLEAERDAKDALDQAQAQAKEEENFRPLEGS
jgi:hypothetical protein